MVGTRADNTNVDAVTLIPASETIDNVNTVASVEVVNGTLAVDTPDLEVESQYVCPIVGKHVKVKTRGHAPLPRLGHDVSSLPRHCPREFRHWIGNAIVCMPSRRLKKSVQRVLCCDSHQET
jgi:hypothetical protein